MTNGSVELSIQYDDMPGEAVVRERADHFEGSGHIYADLIKINTEDRMGFFVDDFHDGATIGLSFFGVENEETKKEFHVRLNVRMGLDDIRQLSEFLDMAIKFQDTKE